MDVDSRVELLRSALPLQELGAWPALPATGALVSFAGLTRTPGLRGRAVERLEFEAYEPMARRVLLRLCREAQARAGGALARVLVAHRVGAVPVGDAVPVGVPVPLGTLVPVCDCVAPIDMVGVGEKAEGQGVHWKMRLLGRRRRSSGM